MSKTSYDQENNILHIIKEKPAQSLDNKSVIEDQPVPQVQQPRQLRGFMVVAVNNEEQLKAFQEGNHNNIQLCPVMANNENDAVELIKSNGKIPLSVSNYEFLKLQTALIEEYAVNQGIELLVLDLYQLKQENV